MKLLNGKLLKYQYENGDTYQILFAENTATWIYAPDSTNPSSGTEEHDVAEIVANVFFISWLEASGEVVSLVVNLNDNIIHASYVYEKTRHFWQGKVIFFGSPDALPSK